MGNCQDDHAEHLVLGHVLDPSSADDLAVLHHRDAVGEIEDVVDVVADKEDADAFGFGLPDELANLRRLGRPKRRGRLVRDKDAGVEMDRARDGDRLPLAAALSPQDRNKARQ